jgi:hypothetical protein
VGRCRPSFSQCSGEMHLLDWVLLAPRATPASPRSGCSIALASAARAGCRPAFRRALRRIPAHYTHWGLSLKPRHSDSHENVRRGQTLRGICRPRPGLEVRFGSKSAVKVSARLVRSTLDSRRAAPRHNRNCGPDQESRLRLFSSFNVDLDVDRPPLRISSYIDP